MRVLVTALPNAPHAQAGQVLDLPKPEALDMISRGTGVAAPYEPPAELPGAPEPDPDPEPVVTAVSPVPAPVVAPKQPRTPRKKKPRG